MKAPAVRDRGVLAQYSPDPLERLAGAIPDPDELVELLLDVLLVPGEQDRLDVGEVLVQRRPADARPLGDVRHLHRCQAVLRHQLPGGPENRGSDVAPVLDDGLVP